MDLLDIDFYNETVPFMIIQGDQVIQWDIPVETVQRSEYWLECSRDPTRLPIQIDTTPNVFQELLNLLNSGDWSAVTELQQVEQLVEYYQIAIAEPVLTELPDLLESLYQADTPTLEAYLDLSDPEIKDGIQALITANKICEIVPKDVGALKELLSTAPKHPLLVRRLRDLAKQIWTDRRDIACQFFQILGKY